MQNYSFSFALTILIYEEILYKKHKGSSRFLKKMDEMKDLGVEIIWRNGHSRGFSLPNVHNANNFVKYYSKDYYGLSNNPGFDRIAVTFTFYSFNAPQLGQIPFL